MTWSPSPITIEDVNLEKPAKPTDPVAFTLTGTGFVKAVDVFFVHTTVSAAQLVQSITGGGRSKKLGVVQADNPKSDGHGVISCTADMRGMKGGKYDAIVVQLPKGQLQTAVLVGAFNWRKS